MTFPCRLTMTRRLAVYHIEAEVLPDNPAT
jgi:hypothetical protein